MFVLLGPDFPGTGEAYQRLARATGLVAYDLRARVRPGYWGVVKALADEAQANALARALVAADFKPVLLEHTVAHDAARRIVPVQRVVLREQDFQLQLADHEMTVEYPALACIVRGEVQPGRTLVRPPGSGPSSASLRAVASATEPPASGATTPSAFEAFQAADLHFLTTLWIARLDLHSLGAGIHDVNPRMLDTLVDELAVRSGARVDRGARNSSVVSLAEQASAKRAAGSEPLGVLEARREQADERFDPYSRLIGEAERQARGANAG